MDYETIVGHVVSTMSCTKSLYLQPITDAVLIMMCDFLLLLFLLFFYLFCGLSRKLGANCWFMMIISGTVAPKNRNIVL